MPTVGEVVIVRSEQKNRGAWTLGVLIELITGKDGVIRGAKVRTGKSTIERPVQFLYPMELSCDDTDERPKRAKIIQDSGMLVVCCARGAGHPSSTHAVKRIFGF